MAGGVCGLRVHELRVWLLIGCSGAAPVAVPGLALGCSGAGLGLLWGWYWDALGAAPGLPLGPVVALGSSGVMVSLRMHLLHYLWPILFLFVNR